MLLHSFPSPFLCLYLRRVTHVAQNGYFMMEDYQDWHREGHRCKWQDREAATKYTYVTG